MNCFQLIKTVLDELFEEIKADSDEERIELIQKAIAHLKGQYRNLFRAIEPIDYSSPIIRFAYIYKYVTSHANLVAQLIESNANLSHLFDNERIKITCAGGGPGSDFLGVLKYIMGTDKTCMVTCNLFDRERAWGDSWNDVGDKIDPDFRVYVNFNDIDITNPATWTYYRKPIRQSDLFTLTYFVSEVYPFRTEAQAFFEYLFETAQEGAFFLYIDNNASSFYTWFDNLAREHGLILVDEGAGRYMMPLDEQKRDLGEYYDYFEDPKITTNAAYSIYQKPL